MHNAKLARGQRSFQLRTAKRRQHPRAAWKEALYRLKFPRDMWLGEQHPYLEEINGCQYLSEPGFDSRCPLLRCGMGIRPRLEPFLKEIDRRVVGNNGIRMKPGHSSIEDAMHIRPQFSGLSLPLDLMQKGAGVWLLKRCKETQVPEIFLEMMGQLMSQEKSELSFPWR